MGLLGASFRSGFDLASKAIQQPPRGRGHAKGGNDLDGGQRASGRGANQTKATQPALVYAIRLRENDDVVNVIADTIFIHFIPYFALIDIVSTNSYIASIVFVNL